MRVDYYLPPTEVRITADHARRAEALGYHGFFTAETSHDPFLPLGVAAAAAPSLELGTGIAVAFARSPMVVAHTAWDLAGASGGRFILGLGTQVRAHLTRRFSTPWAEPGPRLREYVQALRTIWETWQEGRPLRFQGDHYQFSLMTPFFDPGPIEHPVIPVFIAGVGPHLTRLAGEICNGLHVHPFHTVRYLDEVTLPALREGTRVGGRDRADVAVAASVFVATGHTEEEIRSEREAVRHQIAFYASFPTYRPILDLHGWAIGPTLSSLARRREWEAMAGVIDDEILDEVAVSGPPEILGGLLRQRYGDRLQRIALYGVGPGVTPGISDDDWSDLIEAIRS